MISAPTSVSGGWLGQALEALEASRGTERTDRFAQAYARRDRLALTELLCAMEKLSRDEFSAELALWMGLIHRALCAKAGLPADEQAGAVAGARSAPELSAAMEALRLAYDRAQSNVGVGHLCGALRSL